MGVHGEWGAEGCMHHSPRTGMSLPAGGYSLTGSPASFYKRLPNVSSFRVRGPCWESIVYCCSPGRFSALEQSQDTFIAKHTLVQPSLISHNCTRANDRAPPQMHWACNYVYYFALSTSEKLPTKLEVLLLTSSLPSSSSPSSCHLVVLLLSWYFGEVVTLISPKACFRLGTRGWSFNLFVHIPSNSLFLSEGKVSSPYFSSQIMTVPPLGRSEC